MLTAFFTANQTHCDACKYTYQEFPQHLIWKKNEKCWDPQTCSFIIGRLFFVLPTAGKHFYLRTLLTAVKGPTSWADLCTFKDIVYPTFHTAALACGLLQDDKEWQECLLEASILQTGHGLQQLFAIILKHCQPSQPDLLWMSFMTTYAMT